MHNNCSLKNVFVVLVPGLYGRPDKQSNNTTIGVCGDSTTAVFSSLKKAIAFKEVVSKHLFDYQQIDDDPEDSFPYVFQIQILEIIWTMPSVVSKRIHSNKW